VRGRKKTTIPDPAQSCPDGKVNRKFVAALPNQTWVSEFAYVSTGAGMVCVAVIINIFARKIAALREQDQQGRRAAGSWLSISETRIFA